MPEPPGAPGPVPPDWDPVAFLLSTVRQRPTPYAERARNPQGAVRSLLHGLGDPHSGIPCVQIVGSKGKGSTALMLEALLLARGLRVGTFTSPHLSHWCERIRVDGAPISTARFTELMWRIKTVRGLITKPEDSRAASFFDILTAAALSAFREQSVDVAILEAGLGGRLDATTVVSPQLTCITSIELEHTDKLGPTLAAIAGEKAAVIRGGVPVVVDDLPPEALEVVTDRARRCAAPCHRIGAEIEYGARPSGAFEQDVRVSFRGRSTQISLPVPGDHMARNAALAVASADLLQPVDATGPDTRNALIRLQLPGRLERLSHQPLILVDAAHTRGSATALAAVLAAVLADPRVSPLHLVLSVSSERNLDELLETLLPLACRVTVTQADSTRSLAAERLADAVRRRRPEATTHLAHDPVIAMRDAAAALPPTGCLCITGSTYLAGLARTVLARP